MALQVSSSILHPSSIIHHPAPSTQQAASGRFCGQGRGLDPNSLTEQSAATQPSAASWEGTALLHHPRLPKGPGQPPHGLWMRSATRCANPERAASGRPGKQRSALVQANTHLGRCENHLCVVQRCICSAGARLPCRWGTLS